ncbi:hypothetical protein REPUB_Repub01dG0271300 [Reevesia pubescens]
MDGSVVGKPGSTSIGGMLRNEDSVVMIVFSKSVGIADSNEAEFLAIKKAFLIFVASKWVTSYNLIIESDNVNAVKWISSPSCTP